MLATLLSITLMQCCAVKWPFIHEDFYVDEKRHCECTMINLIQSISNWIGIGIVIKPKRVTR